MVNARSVLKPDRLLIDFRCERPHVGQKIDFGGSADPHQRHDCWIWLFSDLMSACPSILAL
jgi:hypothetical protein